MAYRITWKTHIISLIISVLISAGMLNPIKVSLARFAVAIYRIYRGSYNILYFYFCMILLVVILSIFHELIHGLFYTLFGGKVKYGFRVIYAYAQETSGKLLPLTRFMIVLLAPLTLISLISLLLNNWLGYMIYIINLLGSTADFLMALALCKHTCQNKIIDRSYGFDVL